jgi:glutamate-1-semialdehyde aminotransferase
MKPWRPPNPEWQKRAYLCIAQSAVTNSKRPACLVEGVTPTHLVKGEGPYVIDADGNRLIDFICGLGSNLFGYAHSETTSAIVAQAAKGATLSLGSVLEIETAEKVKELFPFIERMKFLKTGSDACSAAIRIARAYTGRKLIVSDAYHGWHDDFVSLTEPALGVPPRTWMRKLTNETLDPDSVAAVIVEAVNLDSSQEYISWLRELRKECTRVGTLLIFDEVITGFRFPKYSVANWTGIEPDIICLGKAMGNGMPISCVAGREKIMNCGEYFVSSTFAGETLSLAAALKVMTLLQSPKYDLDDLWARGKSFLEKFNKIWPEKLTLKGYPTRSVFDGDVMTKALFWQESVKAGILFGPSFFFGFQHRGLEDTVLNAADDILMRIRMGQVKLQGKLPTSPFAQKMREQKNER